MPYPFDRTDVDLTRLKDELAEALGFDIVLTSVSPQTYLQPLMEDVYEDQSDTEVPRFLGRRPTGEDETISLNGSITLLDKVTGTELDVDATLVDAVIKKHTFTPAITVPPLTGDEILRLRALLE